MSARVLSFPVFSLAASRPGRRLRVVPSEDAWPADPEGFKRLMLPHMDAAYGFARHLCRDAAVAEDVVQDAYLRAYRGFAGFRGGDPKAWLLAVVRSSFLDWARRRGASREVADEGAGEAAADPADNAEAALVRAADTKGLLAAVAALPDPFRETLVLRELQELSYREIGEITGAPIGTVMSRLARARAMLVAALRGEGGGS
jgi:RNA polymerase sigma factor (sigma-70 family)